MKNLTLFYKLQQASPSVSSFHQSFLFFRYLLNDGFNLLWSHISRLYYENLDLGLKLVPKLKYDHVNLTPYSAMNVRLTAQVLSETVGKVLLITGSAEVAATANLCLMMDRFFDCLNVRNTEEHKIKLKSFLRPYRNLNDVRFAWLDEFLQYLENWKNPTLEGEGNFSQRDREAMFLPWQT